MKLYCGIDLHSRNCYLAILNERRKLVDQGRLTTVDYDALAQKARKAAIKLSS